MKNQLSAKYFKDISARMASIHVLMTNHMQNLKAISFVKSMLTMWYSKRGRSNSC